MVYYSNNNYCSNSTLTKLKLELATPDIVQDFTMAFTFGTLVDALITEPHKVDHIRMTCRDSRDELLHYSMEEMRQAKAMRDSYLGDQYIKMTRGQVQPQNEFYADELPFEFNGVEFTLPFRCKFDEWMPALGYGHEIKTTAATTQAQFEENIDRYDYDRAAYIYLQTTGSERYVLYGISKKRPHKLFRLFITRAHPLFETGRQKASALAYKYYMLKHQEV